MKKPETISEITLFLTEVIDKVLTLNASSFGKFTSNRLPDDYIYQKWIGKEKDFTDVYLNLDSTNQELFIRYVFGDRVDENCYYYSILLHEFFLFCWNFDSKGCENPFKGKYADHLCKMATGKKNPNWIKAMQILQMFKKLDTNGRTYLTWCCFGKKKEGQP